MPKRNKGRRPISKEAIAINVSNAAPADPPKEKVLHSERDFFKKGFDLLLLEENKSGGCLYVPAIEYIGRGAFKYFKKSREREYI